MANVDFAGARLEGPANGTATYYRYNEVTGALQAELDSSGTVTAAYVTGPGGSPIAVTRGGKTYFYHTNAHGDVTAITGAGGNPLASFTYDAWGVPTELTAAGQSVPIGTWAGSPGEGLFFLFGGMLYDAATGLYLTKSRVYDPKTGRFLSRDILDESGKNGVYKGFPFGKDAIGTNLYAWCGNSPESRSDPSGKSWQWQDIGCALIHEWVDTSHMEEYCDLDGTVECVWVPGGYEWDHYVQKWGWEWVSDPYVDDPNYHGGPPYHYGNNGYGSGGGSWYGSSSYAAYVHAEAVAAYQRAKRQAAVQLQQKMQREAEVATQVGKKYEQSNESGASGGESGGCNWGQVATGGVMMGTGALTVAGGVAVIAGTFGETVVGAGTAAETGDPVLLAEGLEGLEYGGFMVANGGGMIAGGGILIGENVGGGIRDLGRDAWDNTLGRL